MTMMKYHSKVEELEKKQETGGSEDGCIEEIGGILAI